MYRKEIGTYYKPYYDSGDYPQEINVMEISDHSVDGSPLFSWTRREEYSRLRDIAIDEELTYQQGRADRKEEIQQEKSQALLEAEEEMFRRMESHKEFVEQVDRIRNNMVRDDDDFTLIINGKVVV